MSSKAEIARRMAEMRIRTKASSNTFAQEPPNVNPTPLQVEHPSSEQAIQIPEEAQNVS